MSRSATRRTAVGEYFFPVKLFINEMSRDNCGLLQLIEIRRMYVSSISVTKHDRDDVFKVVFWDKNNQLLYNTTIQLTDKWNCRFLATIISDNALNSGLVSVVQDLDLNVALDIARIHFNGLVEYPHWKLDELAASSNAYALVAGGIGEMVASM